MKPVYRFILIAILVLLISAVLAPLLFKFLPFKFEKIFNRIVMVLSLLAVAFFVRLDFKKITNYGFVVDTRTPSFLISGFATGVLVLLVLTCLKIGFHVARWDIEPLGRPWFVKPPSIIFSAFIIGVVEELFFRGILFQTFVKELRWNRIVAVVVVSILYSLSHFLTAKKPFIGPDPGFLDALRLMSGPFLALTQWPEFWRAAVGLFLFGVVLNIASLQTRSLMMSIGLHAGCVFFVKMDGLFVEFSNDNPLVWGSAKMYDSVIGWCFLILMGLVVVLRSDKILKKDIRREV